ncbi:MAG TPA: DNA polymerase III subunit alpha, partial [Aquifex aeolicus]|nr:DNA polymerase III subunit alpha [Aquifex aeolicus]
EILKGKFTPIEDLEEVERGEDVVVAGVITELKVKKTKNGDYMAGFNLVDKTGIIEAIAFPGTYEEFNHLFEEDRVVVIKGFVEEDLETETLKFICKELYTPEEYSKETNRVLRVFITKEQALNGVLERFKELIEENHDSEGYSLLITLDVGEKIVDMMPSPDFKVRITPKLLEKLKEIGIKVAV